MFSTRTGVPPVLPDGFVKVGEGVLRRLQNMLRQWTAQKKKEREAATLSRHVGPSQFSSTVPVNAHHNAGVPAPAAAPQQPARLTGPPMPTAPQFPFGAPNNVGVTVTPAPPMPQGRIAPPMPTAPAASKFLGFFPISTPSTVRSAAAAAPPPKAVKPPQKARSMPSQSRAPATNVGAATAPRPVTQPSRIPVPSATQFTFTAPSHVGAAAAPQAPSTASHPHQSTFTRPPSAMPGNVGVTIPPQMTAGPSSLESIPAQNFWNMPSGQADMKMEAVDFFGITL
ncbi:hypothetical protein BDZ89DRAFT_389487 [Hymenopellis radicata]|nr:hypothetical protein BDZ89DRAFT_389487 [Hymenopellis radicata]